MKPNPLRGSLYCLFFFFLPTATEEMKYDLFIYFISFIDFFPGFVKGSQLRVMVLPGMTIHFKCLILH